MFFVTFTSLLVARAVSVCSSPVIGDTSTSMAAQGRNTSATDRSQAVIDAFRFAWSGYASHCLGQDELHPVSNVCGNSRNGWGASAIDALSTAIMMEQADIVNEILQVIPVIDFSQSRIDEPVSLFETTIRYLGGLLSAYDLLSDDTSKLRSSDGGTGMILDKAIALADSLKYAFESPSGIPYNELWLNNRTIVKGQSANGLATVGTLVLEWQRLSDISGKPEYGELAQRAESYLLNPEPASSMPWPGLTGTMIDIETGLLLDSDGSWDGGDDSAYEYYLKMFVYDSERYQNYATRWQQAADSTMTRLASHPMSRPDLTFLASFSGRRRILQSQHLTCFDGGNFILGGLALRRSDYLDFGLALVDGCHATYADEVTGIGPETFSWNLDLEFVRRGSIHNEVSSYDLRPEVIESYYYAYRATGDRRYQDWAWEAFTAINSTTRTETGFSAISDVGAPDGGEKLDRQESFLFAETLKYSWLIHAEDAVWQVNHNDRNEYVYNTEAHPLKVRGPRV